jgi:hypothetical protein
MTTNTPSKRWRVITDSATGGSSVDYRSRQAAYDATLDLAASPGTVVSIGDPITVKHWEDGRWVLYERAKVTENGWEPA